MLDRTYRLVRTYGLGASATVYEARDAHGAAWAVKWPRRGSDAPGLRREAEALAAGAGPGLVALRELREHAGTPFLVLQLLHGAHLLAGLALLGAGPAVEFGRAWPILKPVFGAIARTLARLHDCGWVHGDVAPRNILLDEGGAPVVLDAGLARKVGSRRACRAGTPGYVPPEGSAGRAAPEIDSFGLGALLYAAITGHPPPAPGCHVADVRGDVAPLVGDFVRRLLLADPDLRPGANELRAFFADVAAEAPAPRAPDVWLAHGRTREAAAGASRGGSDARGRVLLAQIAHLRGGDDGWALRRLSETTTDPLAPAPARIAAAYQLGRMHATAGRTGAAASALSWSRDLATSAGDDRAALLATNGLAYVMLVAGDAGGALDLLEPLEHPSADDGLAARIANHLASACFQACLGSQAIHHRLLAAERFSRVNEPYNLGQCLASLSLDRARLNLPLGREWVAADELARGFDVPDVRVMLEVARAEAAWAAGDARRAAASARTAWDLARRTGRPRLLTGAALVLADALSVHDDHLEAVQLARDAVDSVPCDPGPPLAWEVRARAAGVAERAGEGGLADTWRAEARALALAHTSGSLRWAPARVDRATFFAFPRTLSPLCGALDAGAFEALWLTDRPAPPTRGGAS